MKNPISCIFCFLLFVLASCQGRLDLSGQDPSLEGLEIDLTGLLADGVVIGDIDNPNGIEDGIKLLYSELKDIRKDNREIETVTFILDKEEEKFVLVGYITMKKDGVVVDFHHKDVKEEKSAPVPIGYTGGGCPDGYSSIGKCSNFGDTAECVAELVNQHFSNTLSGIGDCSETRVSISLRNTSVCGRTC